MMVHGLQALAVSIPFSYIHAEILVSPAKLHISCAKECHHWKEK